jgi:hypothetical protein
LILAILLTVSLAAASGPAFAAPSADCPMTHGSKGMIDHEKMGCCPPACAVNCPPAVLAAIEVDLPKVEPSVPPAVAMAAHLLHSVGLTAADPPPRSTIS